MATSEPVFHLRHVMHQPFGISFVRLSGAQTAVALSTEPRDG